MNLSIDDLVWFALLIPSITFHEFMHGWAAYRLGDPTAKDAGRVTLNPLRHVDPFGTVLLPLLLMLSGSPAFGYAKPVPVNPRYFRNVRTGDLITGIAGPSANLLLALFGSACAWAAVLIAGTTGSETVARYIYGFGFQLAVVNLVLMFFNLIPIPPLDGSSIVPIFLSDRALHRWYGIQRYSFAILLLLMWGLPALTGWSPLGAYFDWTVEPLINVLLPG